MDSPIDDRPEELKRHSIDAPDWAHLRKKYKEQMALNKMIIPSPAEVARNREYNQWKCDIAIEVYQRTGYHLEDVPTSNN